MSAQLSLEAIDQLLVSAMDVDDLLDFVDPQTMIKDPDASRTFWKLSEDGSPFQTVIHTSIDARHIYVKRYLQHCNPRSTTATPLSYDDALVEWARISAGTPTYPGSTYFIVE